MKRTNLNGTWELTGGGYSCTGTVPGSVYSFLLNNQLMENPYYRDNELAATEIMDNEFTFSREFCYVPDGYPTLLRCEGLDTLCDIYLNGVHIAYTDNMHRTYEFDVTRQLRSGSNTLQMVFHPADAYIKRMLQEKGPVFGATESMAGYGNLRKAHCMFGWDWGPRLPDAGIWRDIYLLHKNSARIRDVRILQRHENQKVYVTPLVEIEGEAEVQVTCTAPDGSRLLLKANAENEIEHPMLWMPRGLGGQHLYTIDFCLTENGAIVDKTSRRIGLRVAKLIREKDKYGQSYLHEVNGVRFSPWVRTMFRRTIFCPGSRKKGHASSCSIAVTAILMPYESGAAASTQMISSSMPAMKWVWSYFLI